MHSALGTINDSIVAPTVNSAILLREKESVDLSTMLPPQPSYCKLNFRVPTCKHAGH